VHVFNEGLDLPELDTVLMLRPTESRILWLQQFGRGLRKKKDDKPLTVIDYIGNHRTFLLKPQTLFSLPAGGQEVLNLLERAREGPIEIAPGCSVTYELEMIDILKWRGLQALLRGVPGALRRPSAHHDGHVRALARHRLEAWSVYRPQASLHGRCWSPERSRPCPASRAAGGWRVPGFGPQPPPLPYTRLGHDALRLPEGEP
jgi:hypothetical protein